MQEIHMIHINMLKCMQAKTKIKCKEGRKHFLCEFYNIFVLFSKTTAFMDRTEGERLQL
jgi:hypothetical protein